MGVGNIGIDSLCIYSRGIVLSAGFLNFVEESAIGWLLHRPDPSEIVGKVGDNQVLLRWEIGPVAVVAGTIRCCGSVAGRGLKKLNSNRSIWMQRMN